MKLPTSAQTIVGVSFGTIVFLAIVWSFRWLWQTAEELDRNPPRGGVSEQLMNRKSSAMQDILDGMIRGDLRRVERAADRMAEYGNTIRWYVSADDYKQHGERFREATDDLKTAARARDSDAAKEATLRLEESCLECHIQINQRAR